MDTLTHTLTGAVIAKAIDEKRLGNWGMTAGLAMGSFPDSDFVLGLFNHQFYLKYHRDFTHSLILIPFYALFFSWVFVKISKRPYFWDFYKICLLVLISHVILDLLTSYGTMIFSPFFEHRFSWDLVFIIDLIFSGILTLPWAFSLFLKKKARWICRGSLIGLVLYILFCWIQHHHAVSLTKTFAREINEVVIEVASLPQPLSPFRWANHVETEERVYQGFVDLILKESFHSIDEEEGSPPDFSILLKRLKKLYQPPDKILFQPYPKFQNSPWVEKALNTEGVKFYYWFARFPVVRSVNSKNGIHRVEFMDLRFFSPGIRLPFVYYIEFNDSGKIQSEGFVD